MSEEQDKPESEESVEQESGPTGGERLAEARRSMQIPVIEIAKELHLDEHKVRALERNEFDVLGAPVFAKGHLRKYAQLVEVDEADVMADYYQLNRSESAPPVVSSRPLPKPEVSLAPWIAGGIAVVLAAAAWWWFFGREPAATPQISIEQTPQESQEVKSVTLPVTSSVVEDETPAVQEEVETQAEPVAAAPSPEPQSTEIAIRVTYNGDCWTEISDARGRRLFFDLGTTGRTVNLSGEPPLNVLFGDADNVSIEVGGLPYVIPSANRRGRTARLTIAGT